MCSAEKVARCNQVNHGLLTAKSGVGRNELRDHQSGLVTGQTDARGKETLTNILTVLLLKEN